METIIRYQKENSCRSLKSICRLAIKMHLKQFPNDIKQLPIYPSLTNQLLAYLTYENKYAFESYVRFLNKNYIFFFFFSMCHRFVFIYK